PMKHIRLAAKLLCLSMALVPVFVASGEILLVATVTAGEEIAVLAPHGGELEPFTIKVGDSVEAGDTLFRITPKAVYADVDGTVAAVHAADGQSATGAVSRFGAVLQIEHEHRYELLLSTSSGYNSADNRDLWVGTPVFLRAVNGRRFGLGSITEVNGNRFKVAIEDGDLAFDEEVRVFRTEDYAATALLGRAKPSSVPAYRVGVSGTIVSMNVRRGDAVRQGDLLFTYVTDSLSPAQRAQAGRVAAAEPLVISGVSAMPGAAVQQGQALARGYRPDSMQLTAQAGERDILALLPGTEASVYFEELGLGPIPARVSGAAALSAGVDPVDSLARYSVTFDFEAPPGVLFGMHATVQVH
ncbi:MAG TPA: biotin/lipoyl-binding protein, partial [Candidatus Limnocylindria bacterium]|nr:biotin/lipoyl-binding protein [Candidatus Limnocylindria bacterium]